MSYIRTHRLIRPIIRADNLEWRRQMRAELMATVTNRDKIRAAIDRYEKKGGTVTRLPYRGDSLPTNHEEL